MFLRYRQNISDTKSLRAMSVCGYSSCWNDLYIAGPEVLPPRRERNFRRSISRSSPASLHPPSFSLLPCFVFFQTFVPVSIINFLNDHICVYERIMANFYERRSLVKIHNLRRTVYKIDCAGNWKRSLSRFNSFRQIRYRRSQLPSSCIIKLKLNLS